MSDFKGDLPDGYRERMISSVIKIMKESERVINIYEEFDCDNCEIINNGIKVTIEREERND